MRGWMMGSAVPLAVLACVAHAPRVPGTEPLRIYATSWRTAELVVLEPVSP